MKLESEIEEKPAARSYPYLGEHERTGAIVLFNKPNTGVKLSPANAHLLEPLTQLLVAYGRSPLGLGHYMDKWAEDKFEPIDGGITIEQDYSGEDKPDYPYVGVFGPSPTMAVLFTAPDTGVTLATAAGELIGQRRADYTESLFHPLNGSLTLTQTRTK